MARPSLLNYVFSHQVGNQKWTLDLDWTGNAAYNAEKDHDWVVDGKVAGITRSANGLTFASVYAAGHMVSPIKLLPVSSMTKARL